MLPSISTGTQATIGALYPLMTGGNGAAFARVRVADAGRGQHSEGEAW
jgi:hypothetical protein